jgi:hypothetical protein
VSSPIWGSWPDIYCCLTVTVLFLWGALSDERTGLSFIYAAGPCQCSLSLVKSLRTRDHILLSPIWDFPFRRLLRLAGSRWRYSTPPLNWTILYNHFARATQKTHPMYCWDGVLTLYSPMVTLCTTYLNTQKLRFLATKYISVSYGSHSTQRLSPWTALTDWAL